MHFFFFNDTATTEIYTLSLHDALPISHSPSLVQAACCDPPCRKDLDHYPGGLRARMNWDRSTDRKSTRLNSSHGYISYAVFCLKKKTITAFCRSLHRSGLPHYSHPA